MFSWQNGIFQKRKKTTKVAFSTMCELVLPWAICRPFRTATRLAA